MGFLNAQKPFLKVSYFVYRAQCDKTTRSSPTLKFQFSPITPYQWSLRSNSVKKPRQDPRIRPLLVSKQTMEQILYLEICRVQQLACRNCMAGK